MMTVENRTDRVCHIMKSFKNISYLADQGLSLNGIHDALEYMFPDATITPLSSDKLIHNFKGQADLIVLPGSNSEQSPYPNLLPPDMLPGLFNAIESEGLGLLTFCAASYYMMEQIEYETRDGEHKRKSGAGFIKGTAVMAFREITRGANLHGKNILDEYIEAKLSLSNKSMDIHLLNVNGPALILDETELSLCHQFAHYADLSPPHCAGLIKRIGKGFICALGVHPELTAQNSSSNYQDKFPKHERSRLGFLEFLREKLEGAKSQNETTRVKFPGPSSAVHADLYW